MFNHSQSSAIHKLTRRPNHWIIEKTQWYVIHLPLQDDKSRGVYQISQQGEVKRSKEDLKRCGKVCGGDRTAKGGDRAIQASLSLEGKIGRTQSAVAQQQAEAEVARDETNPQEKPRKRNRNKAKQKHLNGHVLSVQPSPRLTGEPRPDSQHRPRPQNLQLTHDQTHACGQSSPLAILRKVTRMMLFRAYCK